MEIDYKIIGSRIKNARKAAGLTQEMLEEKLDVSVGYVSQVERAITKPNLDLLNEISEILSCELASLICGSSTGDTSYLIREISEGVSRLSPSERQIVNGLIALILENKN